MDLLIRSVSMYEKECLSHGLGMTCYYPVVQLLVP